MSTRSLEQYLLLYFKSYGVEVRDHSGEPTIKVVRHYILVDDETIALEGLIDLNLSKLAEFLHDIVAGGK